VSRRDSWHATAYLHSMSASCAQIFVTHALLNVEGTMRHTARNARKLAIVALKNA
jgi:hypothetical protein